MTKTSGRPPRKTSYRQEAEISDKPGYAARAAAAKMMAAIVDQKTPMDGVIDDDHGNPAFRALSGADKALVRAILNSGLRHLAWINAILDSYLQTPLPDGARHLRYVLAVAAAQILFLDVPDHSAVDLAVEQARLDPRSTRFANLVNALLRRLSREKDEALARVAADVPIFPAWFQKRLIAAYGADVARKIGCNFITLPPLDLTVKTDPQGWAEKLGGAVLPTGSVRLTELHGAVTELQGFDAGDWWVQDAAAAIPAKLMGDISGKRVADLCAAPGGKTAQLVLAGGKVTAVEQSASRMKRLKGNLARLGFEADFVVSKLEDLKPEELFDAILLDAPCSSTGTIRRHPDVVWTKSFDDVAKLASVQRRLLDAAFAMLAKGGRLVFANCSLDPIEGEELIEGFLRETPSARMRPVNPEEFPNIPTEIIRNGQIRTTPDMMNGVDGFYAAVIERAE
ncbi:16S rRNA (cytosine967-C5)-methyltransferase [Rhizobium sp. SG_E_25_P2]|uniref:RsmB/NOP family class I SAM-dependent RNA methyltransferase n=1 Tax=Rhizobium sp. SG_E_25_P2 TaxID=2879942 RepID=UPI002474B8AC|nr:RsmB/NOP family class I SAM-dependent RNA methyltransferase [Rhizobium sp. SG_E_25_P2]MDH6269362.1 16S rRNA (cytosine967-C5)-methyltransferase [Rhizobium sp. SG_E_25_P2]